MDALTARPQLLKQANLSSIRRVVRARGTATRGEIARETGISATTVRSLLAELVEAGELERAGLDASRGGRKAERYRFRPDRFYGAAFCIAPGQVHSLLVDIYGQVVERTVLDADGADVEGALTARLDALLREREIRSIGVGVPGVVDGGCYWTKDTADAALRRVDIGEVLAKRYGIPVLLENDLNATALGFARCYAREFPGEDPSGINMAYVHFESWCVSAGFILDGRIVRGFRSFAGELSLVPVSGGRLLDERMSEPMSDGEFTELMIQVIGFICGVLNPQYVALGGPAFRRDCLGPIGDGLSALLERDMAPELLYAPDVWHDYYDGLAYLTAEKLFGQVQFVQG